MKQLIVATRNRGKLAEIAAMLPQYTLLTLDDIGFEEEIPEPYDTFRENALAKASTVFHFCGKPVIADDSGLCIDALNGSPGVQSATYAGLPRSDERNVSKVLRELNGFTNRAAYFISIISFIDESGNNQPFEGRCDGSISYEPHGHQGFGYDPIFIPEGFSQTLGQMDAVTKNSISHRARSVAALVRFLQQSGDK